MTRSNPILCERAESKAQRNTNPQSQFQFEDPLLTQNTTERLAEHCWNQCHILYGPCTLLLLFFCQIMGEKFKF